MMTAHPHCSRRARRPRGFSLLELLVAMAIMAMSLTLIYQVDAGVLRGVADLQAQQRATVLAQSLLDSREAVPAAGWQEEGQAAGMAWSVRSHVEPLPAGLIETTPLLHRVEIVVHWHGRIGARDLVLSTLLPQENPLPGRPLP